MNDSNLNKAQANQSISETDNLKEFTFTEGNKGNVPISRDNDGKICLIDSRSKNLKMVQAGETWECKVTKNSDSVIIVDPVTLKITKEQNKVIMKNMAEDLKLRFKNQ